VLAIGQADIDDTKGTSIQAPQLNADVSQTDDGAQLQDDVAYNVVIRATDQYGNLSEPSGAVPGTPIHILDFYGLYRTDGGRATGGGGCSSPGPATWIAVLALLTALFARRRKKTRNGALLVAFVTVLAPKAQAAGYERPKRFLLVALKVDRYDPKVDSEAGLTANPYHQIFGPRAPLRYQLEVDWEAWHPYGSLLFGVTAGYWQNFGKGLVADTRAKSQDTALLDVVPIGLIATYRFDQLADMWPRFPVIPYVQAGVMRALWASFNGTGSVSKDANGGSGKGSGWTWGYTTALGVAFALDAIDPDLSREAYQDTGIQRSSIFAEYGWTRLDGFHNNTSLILSDRAWRFGVAMEF
jgi:MYXO-CTERM domain-containing protein